MPFVSARSNYKQYAANKERQSHDPQRMHFSAYKIRVFAFDCKRTNLDSFCFDTLISLERKSCC